MIKFLFILLLGSVQRPNFNNKIKIISYVEFSYELQQISHHFLFKSYKKNRVDTRKNCKHWIKSYKYFLEPFLIFCMCVNIILINLHFNIASSSNFKNSHYEYFESFFIRIPYLKKGACHYTTFYLENCTSFLFLKKKIFNKHFQ